jgi:hypothetical protein
MVNEALWSQKPLDRQDHHFGIQQEPTVMGVMVG